MDRHSTSDMAFPPVYLCVDRGPSERTAVYLNRSLIRRSHRAFGGRQVVICAGKRWELPKWEVAHQLRRKEIARGGERRREGRDAPDGTGAQTGEGGSEDRSPLSDPISHYLAG